jgi:hypothetical protein
MHLENNLKILEFTVNINLKNEKLIYISFKNIENKNNGIVKFININDNEYDIIVYTLYTKSEGACCKNYNKALFWSTFPKNYELYIITTTEEFEKEWQLLTSMQ